MKPATETDRIAQPVGVRYEARVGYTRVSCEERGNYNDGNLLLLDTAPEPGSLTSWLATWHRELGGRPDLLRVALRWESSPGAPPPAAIVLEAAALGLGATINVALLLADLAAVPLPEGISVRPLAAADWRAVVALHQEEAETESGRDFVHWHVAQQRALVEGGRARWWGAFSGEGMAAVAGLAWDDTWCGLHEVATARAFRRRGICAALCHHAIRAHRSEHPDSRVVVVAERDGDAERVYRRLGFVPGTTQWTLSRPR
jgi:GNAT superfamily N-acetyltransferase